MNLKIFKLRSGEEVIGQIIDEFKTKFIVSNPFVFRTSTMADHNGTYDMTVLRDWLIHTENKTMEIPKNHIVTQCDPKKDTEKLYHLQIETEKTLEEKVVSMDGDDSAFEEPASNSEAPTGSENIFQDFLNSLLHGGISDDTEKESNPYESARPRPRRRKSHNNEMPSPEMNPREMDRHGIYVSMMLPSEAIMNLITAGLLDPKDILRMIKEVKRKNRFTGDEKDRKDFGSKYSDWNPDPSSEEYK